MRLLYLPAPDCMQLIIKGQVKDTDENQGLTFENFEGTRQWNLQPRSKSGNSAGFDTLIFTAGNTSSIARQVTFSSSQTGSVIIAKEVSEQAFTPAQLKTRT